MVPEHGIKPNCLCQRAPSTRRVDMQNTWSSFSTPITLPQRRPRAEQNPFTGCGCGSAVEPASLLSWWCHGGWPGTDCCPRAARQANGRALRRRWHGPRHPAAHCGRDAGIPGQASYGRKRSRGYVQCGCDAKSAVSNVEAEMRAHVLSGCATNLVPPVSWKWNKHKGPSGL